LGIVFVEADTPKRAKVERFVFNAFQNETRRSPALASRL
jgi:hypothetical protein